MDAELRRGETMMEFEQTGIPEQDKYGNDVLPQVKRGWEHQFWERFQSMLGFKRFDQKEED